MLCCEPIVAVVSLAYRQGGAAEKWPVPQTIRSTYTG